jgi:ketosteroid isomerase-like protein
MRTVLITLISVVFLVAGCVRAPATQSLASPDVIVDSFLKSLSRGDVDACLGLLADDVVFRQEPSGIKLEGKAPFEESLRRAIGWHLQYSVVTPIKVDGDRVAFTAKVSEDDFKIIGLEYMNAGFEIQVREGKIESWVTTVSQEDWSRLTELTAGGIGIKFEFVEQGMRIKETATNSPAYQAGIRSGDIIVGVNGVSYSQMRKGKCSSGFRDRWAARSK